MNITQSIVSERDRALLGGDYAAYHSQATRRIQSLRRRLGDATPRGRKYTQKSPITADKIAENREWVQLLLASSERSWAHAMAMRSLQSPENTQKPMAGSTKKQIRSRYKRAITYANNLVEAVRDRSTSKSSAVDVLEANAYLAMLNGGLNFEKGHWQACIDNYAIAHVIYSALATGPQADIYKDLLSTTVDPSMRFAAHQLKYPRTKLVSDIAIEQFPKNQPELKHQVEEMVPDAFTDSSAKVEAKADMPTNLPSSISWRSRNVKVEDASISQALGIAQDRESAFRSKFEQYKEGNINTRDFAALFDDVINARQDAVDNTKNAIDELRGEGVDQGDPRVQSLQVTRTAVNYAVIEWRVGRNRILCGLDDGLQFQPENPKQSSKQREDGKSKTPKEESSGRKLARLRERIVLYDAILQSLDSIKELPGVIADSTFVEELDGKAAYFRGLKCLTLGRSHSINGNVKNALALYAKSNDLAQTASRQLQRAAKATDGPPKLDISATQLKDLQTLTSSTTLQYQALADLQLSNTKQTAKDKTFVPPFIERIHLQQYDDELDLSNLVNYPPKLQPVPVKPIFFDLAWKYVDYPGKSSQTNGSVPVSSAIDTQTEAKPAKKGWFGFGR